MAPMERGESVVLSGISRAYAVIVNQHAPYNRRLSSLPSTTMRMLHLHGNVCLFVISYFFRKHDLVEKKKNENEG